MRVGNERRRRGREQLERCCHCRELFDVATMIAWSDGMWCRGDAIAALEEEMHRDEIELRRELRAVQAERAAADAEERRQDRAERVCGAWS